MEVAGGRFVGGLAYCVDGESKTAIRQNKRAKTEQMSVACLV